MRVCQCVSMCVWSACVSSTIPTMEPHAGPPSLPPPSVCGHTVCQFVGTQSFVPTTCSVLSDLRAWNGHLSLNLLHLPQVFQDRHDIRAFCHLLEQAQVGWLWLGSHTLSLTLSLSLSHTHSHAHTKASRALLLDPSIPAIHQSLAVSTCGTLSTPTYHIDQACQLKRAHSTLQGLLLKTRMVGLNGSSYNLQPGVDSVNKVCADTLTIHKYGTFVAVIETPTNKATRKDKRGTFVTVTK